MRSPLLKIAYALVFFLIGMGQLHSIVSFFSPHFLQEALKAPDHSRNQDPSSLICHSKTKPQFSPKPYKHHSPDELFSFSSEPFLPSLHSSSQLLKNSENKTTFLAVYSLVSFPPETPPPKNNRSCV